MPGDVYLVQADLTELTADILVVTSSAQMEGGGGAHRAFCDRYEGYEQEYQRLKEENPHREIGTTFWVPVGDGAPVRGHGRVKGIVIVVAAGDRGMPASPDRAETASRAAMSEALTQLCAAPAASGRRLIVLPAIGFGAGRYRDLLECGRRMIGAAAELLRACDGIDAVFSTHNAQDYALLLQARKQAGAEPTCPLTGPRVDALAAALREKRCVPFVGAGLSLPAGFPDWNGLLRELAQGLDLRLPDTRDALRRLADESGVAADGVEAFIRRAGQLQLQADPFDLDFTLDLAQWYEQRRGRPDLEGLIRRRFGEYSRTAIKPTLAHYFLMSLPVRVVLTTNFEDLLERTLRALRLDPEVVVEEREVVVTGQADRPCVVKFHGDAGGPEPDTQVRNVILTRDDFDGFFRKRPVFAKLLEGELLNQTFLFVGYRLRDPNTRQIYSHVAHLLQDAKRHAFAVSVDGPAETDRYYVEQWERQGLHVLAMPGDTLDERVRSSLRLFDWLARETVERPELLLTPHVPDEDLPDDLRPLTALRDALRAVADVLPEAMGTLPQGNGRVLALVLELLMRLGWRPQSAWDSSLRRHLEQLAEAVGGDASARRRLLRLALRVATGRREIAAIRKRLRDL